MFSRQVLRSARVAAPRRLVAAPVRTFAAAAANEVKPPVQVFGVDGTYATALVRSPSMPTSKTIRRRVSRDGFFSNCNWGMLPARYQSKTRLYRSATSKLVPARKTTNDVGKESSRSLT